MQKVHESIIDLVCFIYEELDGACEYIDKAMEYKMFNKEFADYLLKLAEEELKHANLHLEWITKISLEYTKHGNIIDDKMIWEFEKVKDDYNRKSNKIKLKITTYKSML